jgi:hypothetical protein
VCELALAQGVPGFSLLSERHGEGAASHSLELSSQTFSLFQVSHGDGFGDCHCHLGRRRLGALLNELGVFAGEGRLEELFDQKARPVAGHDGHMTSLATAAALPLLEGASTRLTAAARGFKSFPRAPGIMIPGIGAVS